MLVVIVTARNVPVITLARLLGLADGIGAALDRQVGGRLRLSSPPFIMVLPAPVLDVALELLAVVAANDFSLRPRLMAFASPLAIARIPVVAALAAIGPATAIIAVIGEPLRTDAHTQQTNACQTPDARFHAIPHNG